MAASRQKKKAQVRFELSWGGIAGIAVVIFCVFLWMFLLGVWAGQSLLFGPAAAGKPGQAQHQKKEGGLPRILDRLQTQEPAQESGH